MRRTCARVHKVAPRTAWSLTDTNRSPSRLLRRSSPRTEGNDEAERDCPCALGARTIRVAGLPLVLAHRAHSEGAGYSLLFGMQRVMTRAVGGRPTTLENVPGRPLRFDCNGSMTAPVGGSPPSPWWGKSSKGGSDGEGEI